MSLIIIFLGDKIRYGKVTLAVLMVITILLAAGLLLSLIKQSNIKDIHGNNETLYHNTQDVTLLLGGEIDLRYYDNFNISLTSESRFGFSATVCQVQCSPQIINPLHLDYTDTINITDLQYCRNYIKFVSEDNNVFVPSHYILKGSEVKFVFELKDVTNLSEVILNIFTDVRDCQNFKGSPSSEKAHSKSHSLNNVNNFTAFHHTESDGYICVVADSLANTSSYYTYSVTGLVSQYYDVFSLANQNLCAKTINFNDSLVQHKDVLKIGNSLDRPSALLVSPSDQRTCLLATVSSSCRYSTCYFIMNWLIFATLENPGVIATSAIGAVLFIVFLVLLGVFMFMCVML